MTITMWLLQNAKHFLMSLKLSATAYLFALLTTKEISFLIKGRAKTKTTQIPLLIVLEGQLSTDVYAKLHALAANNC